MFIQNIFNMSTHTQTVGFYVNKMEMFLCNYKLTAFTKSILKYLRYLIKKKQCSRFLCTYLFVLANLWDGGTNFDGI